MDIRLTGKKSICEEIKDTYEYYIRLGAFREGERLPSVHKLAVKLGVNPNTVERAYTALERSGLIRTIPKKGVYVCRVTGKSYMYEEMVYRLTLLKGGGLTREEALAAVEEVYAEPPPPAVYGEGDEEEDEEDEEDVS